MVGRLILHSPDDEMSKALLSELKQLAGLAGELATA
jgi:hypothetical protein